MSSDDLPKDLESRLRGHFERTYLPETDPNATAALVCARIGTEVPVEGAGDGKPTPTERPQPRFPSDAQRLLVSWSHSLDVLAVALLAFVVSLVLAYEAPRFSGPILQSPPQTVQPDASADSSDTRVPITSAVGGAQIVAPRRETEAAPGQQRVSVMLSGTGDVARPFAPGDRVDVLAFFSGDNPAAGQWTLVADDVEVLAVGPTRTVTLAVPSQAAAWLSRPASRQARYLVRPVGGLPVSDVDAGR